jgi:hypothetical protein
LIDGEYANCSKAVKQMLRRLIGDLPKPSDPPKDGFGQDVPRRVEEVFKDRADYEWAVHAIDSAISTINRLSTHDASFFMPVDDIVVDLNKARVAILHNMPWRLCDCEGKDDQCEKCDGKRWTTAIRAMGKPRDVARGNR